MEFRMTSHPLFLSLERPVIVNIRIVNASTVEPKCFCCPNWRQSGQLVIGNDYSNLIIISIGGGHSSCALSIIAFRMSQLEKLIRIFLNLGGKAKCYTRCLPSPQWLDREKLSLIRHPYDFILGFVRFFLGGVSSLQNCPVAYSVFFWGGGLIIAELPRGL